MSERLRAEEMKRGREGGKEGGRGEAGREAGGGQGGRGKYLRRKAYVARAYDQVSDHCVCSVCCACMPTTMCMCASLHVYECFCDALRDACVRVHMHACSPHLEVTIHNQHCKSVLKSKFHIFVVKSSQGAFWW